MERENPPLPWYPRRKRMLCGILMRNSPVHVFNWQFYFMIAALSVLCTNCVRQSDILWIRTGHWLHHSSQRSCKLHNNGQTMCMYIVRNWWAESLNIYHITHRSVFHNVKNMNGYGLLNICQKTYSSRLPFPLI